MKLSLISILSLSLVVLSAGQSIATEATYKDDRGTVISVSSEEIEIPVADDSSTVYPHMQEGYQQNDPNTHTLNVGGKSVEFVSDQNQHTASCTNLTGTVAKIIVVNSNDPEKYLSLYNTECVQWGLDQKSELKPALK